MALGDGAADRRATYSAKLGVLGHITVVMVGLVLFLDWICTVTGLYLFAVYGGENTVY